jgi:hypothetical protein
MGKSQDEDSMREAIRYIDVDGDGPGDLHSFLDSFRDRGRKGESE